MVYLTMVLESNIITVDL